MTITQLPTPQYGARIVPITIDEIASTNPNRVFASIPKTSNLNDGFRDITYFEFARAINRAAWWIEERFRRSETFETLAYMGLFDIRYFVVIVAACKVGYKTLLLSPRNSLEGQLNLLQQTACKIFLTSPNYPLPPTLIPLASIPHIEIPSLEHFLSTSSSTTHQKEKLYPFTKTFEEAKYDPFVVIHTSGSTGLPKPVILKHAWMCASDSGYFMPEMEGCVSTFNCLRGLRMYSAMPLFHAAGMVLGLLAPIFMDVTTVWALPNHPPSAILTEEMIDQGKLDMILSAPSILEELIDDPITKAKVETLSVVGFGGGPLAQKFGDQICHKVQILNAIGSTEVCTLPTYKLPGSDWIYFQYNSLHQGIQFRPQGDGTYEQVIVRHPSTDKFHSAFITFPEIDEYHMNDLYVKHPEKEGLWKYVGRKDDVLVLSNGEKVNPSGMERVICECVDIKGCLVVGQGRFDVGAILEVKREVVERLKTAEERARWVEEVIWPFVVEANKSAPSHGQLALDKIVLSDLNRPFLKTPKGSVRRAVTVKIYGDIIKRIYAGEEGKEAEVVDIEMINLSWDTEILEKELGEIIEDVIGLKGLERDQDMFNAGMDSLHVMKIMKQLKVCLTGIQHEKLSTRLIYANPTISSLVLALKQISITNGTANGKAKTREELMEETLQKYIAKLPPPSPRARTRKTVEPRTVLLTGSTGSLGSYLLHILLTSPNIAKVYCLNRSSNARERQAKGNAQKELISKWDHKIEFLHTDLSKPFLGLEEIDYERLRNEVDAMIHNQWQVDFNLSLRSFEPHILGTLNLIHLSTTTTSRAPIYFTSSIGTIQNYPLLHPSTPLIPEHALTDPRVPLAQGYGTSKWITERLLDVARQTSQVSSAVLRVGQIAGPIEIGRKGVWNRQEWLPTIIASSKFLHAIPENLPGMDDVTWVPVDILARVIVELMEEGLDGKNDNEVVAWTKYFHLCNPKEGNWRDLVEVVKEYFGDDMRVISFSEWLEKLSVSSKGKYVDIQRNPGVKLLDFYEGMEKTGVVARLDTVKTREASESMKNLKSVDGKWMKQWLEQWNY